MFVLFGAEPAVALELALQPDIQPELEGGLGFLLWD